MKLPRVNEGDPITAELFNLLLAAAEGCNLDVGPGLTMEKGPNGMVLSSASPRPFRARITGAPTGTLHPWIEVFPDASGTWSDGSRTGDAYEVNASTTNLSNKYVRIWWSVGGYYMFETS